MTLYAAHKITLRLLEEHDLCVLQRPSYEEVWKRTRPWARAYGVVIECRTPLEYWDALPDDVAQAKINALRARWLCKRTNAFDKPLWLEWDKTRKLFCAPEHIEACKNESWPHIGIDFVREHLQVQATDWMTFEKPPVGIMPTWGKPRFMPTTYELQAEMPREEPPALPTRVIIYTNERGCGHCPASLACIRGHALAYPSSFYFTMCPRCHCLHFTANEHRGGPIYLCAILRSRGNDAEYAVRRAVFGPETRGLLTSDRSCITRWQTVADFEARGPNKVMPMHWSMRRGNREQAGYLIASYDCVDLLQELSATEDIPLVVY
jgi:hypothetical protein